MSLLCSTGTASWDTHVPHVSVMFCRCFWILIHKHAIKRQVHLPILHSLSIYKHTIGSPGLSYSAPLSDVPCTSFPTPNPPSERGESRAQALAPNLKETPLLMPRGCRVDGMIPSCFRSGAQASKRASTEKHDVSCSLRASSKIRVCRRTSMRFIFYKHWRGQSWGDIGVVGCILSTLTHAYRWIGRYEHKMTSR